MATWSVFIRFAIFSLRLHSTLASTHWVVTENGKLQSQVDSVFNMKRPYDLVAFMKQEERASMLDHLKMELLSRKDEIDKTDDRDTGLEEKFYKTDPDCLAAGKHLPELDLYISTVLPLENKGIRPEDYISGITPGSILMPPDCTIYTDLPYSIHAFEHLEGMKDREKLAGTPELGLKNAITYQDNVDEYGHRIYESFKQNKTSWVLYNMAAFYWRIKGDPLNVIECVRRALHYSPRGQKDVALISLANVLHRARYSNEAAVVVHAALDVSKELNVNHFTLGNIYAVLGEYNKSVICFENTLKIQPDFEAAAKRKHAVLCHAKLETALEAQHRSLQQTLNDLKDYQRKHDYWQQQNDKLLAEQVPIEVKMSQHAVYEEMKIKEMSTDIGDYCKMGDKDGKQVLMCSWTRKHDPAIGMDFSLSKDKHADGKMESQMMEDDKIEMYISGNVDYSKPLRPEKYTEATVRERKREGVPEYLGDDWPSKEDCDTHVQKVPDSHRLPLTYLSPENKGYDVKALLMEAQGLKAGDQHPLPWYPPVCVTLLDIPEGNTKSHDDIASISYQERTKIPLKLFDSYHMQTLLDHVVGKITIEEMGQRILTAIKKNIGPKWILFNLAGLYWRIIGNNYHAIECFRRSVYTAPDLVQDVPEVNMANVLYMWERYTDAHDLLREAFKLNHVEPAGLFLMGNILWAKKNYTGAAWRYQLALESEPGDIAILNTLRELKCFVRFHHSAQSAAPVEPQENGEEKCVIETRTRNKNGDCDGTCTQTCTVAPISKDTCGGAGDNAHAIEGPGGRRSCAQCGQCVRHTKCPNPASNQVNKCGGAQQKGPVEQFSQAPEDVMFGGDFSEKLDEVSEHYEQKGVCEGDDCNELRVQQNGQTPHIKLDFVNGVLHQKLIFAQSPNELTVEADECVIFNDGSKSSGCSQPEYRAYMQEYDNLDPDTDSIQLFVNGHLTKVIPLEVKMSRNGKAHTDRPEQVMVKFELPQGPAADPDVMPAPPPLGDVMEMHVVELPQGPVIGPEKPPPLEHPSMNSGHHQHIVVEGSEIRYETFRLSDTVLPDTRMFIKRRVRLPPPTLAECKKMKKVNLQKFSSTWLSLSAKHINLRDHLNLNKNPKTLAEPVCDTRIVTETIIDEIPGVVNRDTIVYSAETGLRDVLQHLDTTKDTVEVVGARIAEAMKLNASSWVLSTMAGLYWRVKGHAKNALDCLSLAVFTAPQDTLDVALLSVANILHRAGHINDAIVVMGYAMGQHKDLVVSHFTMANLYAAKKQWDLASMFYESTLGLQARFEPAKQRLRTIQCMRLSQKSTARDKQKSSIT